MSIISRIMNTMSSKRRQPAPFTMPARAQLRSMRRMNRQRGDVQYVINPAGTKLLKKIRKGTLGLKWGA